MKPATSLHSIVTQWAKATTIANAGDPAGVMRDFSDLSSKMTVEAVSNRGSHPELLRLLGPVLNLTIAVLVEQMSRVDRGR